MENLNIVNDLLPFFGALLAAGLIAGFLAGVFGIGGGAILVPVFYQMFGELGVDDAIRMHLSVGTSLAIIVPTSIRSYLTHLKSGQVDTALLRSWLVIVPIGVALAAMLSIFISGAGLRGIFAVIAILVGAKLIFAKESWRLGDDVPQNPGRAFAGALIGFVSTFMGIGGGVMNNTFMTLYGRSMHQAVSTSSGVGVLISLPGAIGYMLAGMMIWNSGPDFPPTSIGFVNFLTVIIIIPVTLVVAPFGARVAHRLSKRRLEVAFGIFMFIVAGRFLYSLVG